MSHPHPESELSAGRTLDQIRDGGQQLVVLCQARLADCARAISEGRFFQALQHAQEAYGKLQGLAAAEGALGSLAESFVLRAVDVQEGMTVVGLGVVASVRVEEKAVPGAGPCQHVHLAFEGDAEDIETHADQEMVVARA